MPNPTTRPYHHRARTPRTALTLIALACLLATTACPRPAVAQPTTPLLVDDAATANPALVQVDLTIPDGFAADPRSLSLPLGFSISLLAAGLGAPRFMTFDAAGNLLVADQAGGNVYRYPATDGTVAPAATPPEPLLTGLDAPSSVALHPTDAGEYLYVGETSQVIRAPYDPTAPLGDTEIVIPDLPTGGHGTRTVAFGPDGLLYLAVGSSCNICDEDDDRRAAVLRFTPDGADQQVLARGLRNPVGLAVQPGTDRLWATVNERDNLGNELPPDLVTVVEEGADYGWPACQPPSATPQQDGADCSSITPPTVGIQAHSAPLGLAFYTGDAFPEPYRDDLIVAQHGSWNRQPPAAPKLLLLQFENGQPVAAVDLATGWQDASGNRWGRPAGVAVAPDGSLVVSDDDAGLLYRITYDG